MEEQAFLTWNAAWASPTSRAWSWATQELLPGVGVAALTELRLDSLAHWRGHVLGGGSDWGYTPSRVPKRKVGLWSRHPWNDVDPVGSPELPAGRFVSGTTAWRGVPVRVVCVCVPWSAAHVSTGRRDRSRWQDHLAYLTLLPEVLAGQRRYNLPLVVAGDFNQTIPASMGRQPRAVATALASAVEGLNVVTSGLSGRGPLIDHVAVDQEVTTECVKVVKAEQAGRALSDHDAVLVV